MLDGLIMRGQMLAEVICNDVLWAFEDAGYKVEGWDWAPNPDRENSSDMIIDVYGLHDSDALVKIVNSISRAKELRSYGYIEDVEGHDTAGENLTGVLISYYDPSNETILAELAED